MSTDSALAVCAARSYSPNCVSFETVAHAVSAASISEPAQLSGYLPKGAMGNIPPNLVIVESRLINSTIAER